MENTQKILCEWRHREKEWESERMSAHTKFTRTVSILLHTAAAAEAASSSTRKLKRGNRVIERECAAATIK